jgi:toxin ParE1/3/4
VKNFFVYYRIDDTHKKVYILNVIYARRDQLRALEQMNID